MRIEIVVQKKQKRIALIGRSHGCEQLRDVSSMRSMPVNKAAA